MEKKKLNKELKGWQIFVVAIILFIIGIALNNLIGSFMIITSNILVLFAIATGISNINKKRKQSKVE